MCRYFVQEDVMEINQLTMQKSGWRVEEILRNYFFLTFRKSQKYEQKKNEKGNVETSSVLNSMINGFAVFVDIVCLYVHLDSILTIAKKETYPILMNNSLTDNHPFVGVKNVQSFCCQKVYGAANLFVVNLVKS